MSKFLKYITISILVATLLATCGNETTSNSADSTEQKEIDDREKVEQVLTSFFEDLVNGDFSSVSNYVTQHELEYYEMTAKEYGEKLFGTSKDGQKINVNSYTIEKIEPYDETRLHAVVTYMVSAEGSEERFENFTHLIIPLFILLLVGCSSSNSPAKTVENMYQAALDRDLETFSTILSGYDAIRGFEQAAMEDIATDVIDYGGISKLNITELSEKELNDDFVEFLNNNYNDWAVVSHDISEDEVYVWILQKVDGTYYIVNGTSVEKDELLK